MLPGKFVCPHAKKSSHERLYWICECSMLIHHICSSSYFLFGLFRRPLVFYISDTHSPSYNPGNTRPWIPSAGIWHHQLKIWQQQPSLEQLQHSKTLCDFLLPSILSPFNQICSLYYAALLASKELVKNWFAGTLHALQMHFAWVDGSKPNGCPLVIHRTGVFMFSSSNFLGAIKY